MTEFTLERLAHDDKSTHSQFLSENGLTPLCHAIERAVTGDHPRIVSGRYKLRRRPFGESHFDAKLRSSWPWYCGIIEVTGVAGRSAIEIHPANWASELRGCIAPCHSAVHDADKGWTGVSSKNALATLYRDYLYPALDNGDTFLIVRDLD